MIWPPEVIATAVPHPVPLPVQAAAVYVWPPGALLGAVKLTVREPLVVLVPDVTVMAVAGFSCSIATVALAEFAEFAT